MEQRCHREIRQKRTKMKKEEIKVKEEEEDENLFSPCSIKR